MEVTAGSSKVSKRPGDSEDGSSSDGSGVPPALRKRSAASSKVELRIKVLKKAMRKGPRVIRPTGNGVGLPPALKKQSNVSPDAEPSFMSPDQALALHGSQLTSFERAEIVNFSQIWFLGLEARKIGGIVGSANNNGYDDEAKLYNYRKKDQVGYRYELLETIGNGSSSQVVKALDHKTGVAVALKIFRNEEHLQAEAEQEVRILNHLKTLDGNKIPNVVHILDTFEFRNHRFISFELLAQSLFLLKFETCFKGFGAIQVKEFVLPILRCLQALGEKKIVHGDLSLDNILLKHEGRNEVKVIDFGNSHVENEKGSHSPYNSVCYRAPELILGLDYGRPVDMWAVGCILVELGFGSGWKLLPGEDEQDQMACIVELIGKPPVGLLEKANRAQEFFSDNNTIPLYCEEVTKKNGNKFLVPKKKETGTKRGPPGTRDLAQVLGMASGVNPTFIDFVRKCLLWEPEARLTPCDALRHPWITEMDSETPGCAPLRAKTTIDN